jgi:hypothetical protein
MTIRLDFTTPGVLNVTDTDDLTLRAIVLGNVSSLGQMNNDFVGDMALREGAQVVVINENIGEDTSSYSIDIRDVEGEPYASTQELLDEIQSYL